MNPTKDTDYKQLFTQLIKKQILILGPDITLAKVKNVPGLTVNQNGEVQSIQGDPQAMLQMLINQFVELSGMIVKKTMESILTSYPGMAGLAAGSLGMTGSPPQAPQPANNLVNTTIPVSSDAKNPSVLQPVQAPNPKPEEHPVPPPMSAMNLDSLSTPKEEVKKEENNPSSFSSKEMEDLNKALDQLSKAPLSSESQPASV